MEGVLCVYILVLCMEQYKTLEINGRTLGIRTPTFEGGDDGLLLDRYPLIKLSLGRSLSDSAAWAELELQMTYNRLVTKGVYTSQ